MPAIRTWVIVTAAAFLALPSANAWARDCKRHPSLCAQSAETKTANAAARVPPRRRSARRASRNEPRRSKLPPTRAVRRASHRQPAKPASKRPAPKSAPRVDRRPSRRSTPFADDHDHRLGGDAARSRWRMRPRRPMAKRHDQPALAAAGGAIALPGNAPPHHQRGRIGRPAERGRCRRALRQSRTTSTRSTSPRSGAPTVGLAALCAGDAGALRPPRRPCGALFV